MCFLPCFGGRQGGAPIHPELDEEQAYIDHAYACLDASRERASKLRSMVDVGRGGTDQARFERDVIEDEIAHRLARLELGDASLVFGRLDTTDDEAFHIGRIGVADDRQEPVVVDWRAPVAEAFYRATGRDPMGLVRRRHFATRGRHLLDMEDELFGLGDSVDGQQRITGYGALLAAIEQSRTGRLSDIVATIQFEQDEVIRSELAGLLVVQGGPGTGKTVVALHRAAYLLYTHRFPLQGQGVLVVGPNRLFLRYIERVLPSLGEAGVEQAVLADLIVVPQRDGEALPILNSGAAERADIAQVKGDDRMAKVVARAVRDRERPLRDDLVLGFGTTYLRLTVGQSADIVRSARRRYRIHNGGRRWVERQVYDALAASSRDEVDPHAIREQLRGEPAMRLALERLWPVLTPMELLHDLYGSRALLRNACHDVLDDRDCLLLHRPRSESVDQVVWSDADVPVLDEAYALLGPRSGKRFLEEEARTYGHIVVDEAQDLSPMALRLLSRRSLNGSMTLVGDIAQATAPKAAENWHDVISHLPSSKRGPRRAELTIGYRIPAQNMALAARVLSVAAPDLVPPTSVREGDSPPRIIGAAVDRLLDAVVEAVLEEQSAVGDGSVAVICPRSMAVEISDALQAAGIEHGRIGDRTFTRGLDMPVTVVPVTMVKGLELDSSVVVEPARIVRDEPQGLRALYVALTRSTQRLALIHAEPLPEALSE